MTNARVRDNQTLFDAGSLVGLSGGELLDRYKSRREEAVFETIVRRQEVFKVMLLGKLKIATATLLPV